MKGITALHYAVFLNKLMLGVSFITMASGSIASASQADVTQDMSITSPVQHAAQGASQQIQFEVSLLNAGSENFSLDKNFKPSEIIEIFEKMNNTNTNKLEISLYVPNSQSGAKEFQNHVVEILWNYVRAVSNPIERVKRLELIPIPNSDTDEVYDKNYQEIIF